MGYLQGDKPITITKLLAMHAEGEKISMLTAYDSTMSALLNRCGVETILIGDSLGNVIQGHSSTTAVTVEQVAYHTRCVARANTHAFVIADLPFASYGNPAQALESSAQLMRAGADMVKLEGGGDWQVDVIRHLVERSVPVCAHLGLLPQSVHVLVETPVKLTDEQKKLLQKFDDSLKSGGDKHSPQQKGWFDGVKSFFS
jgi:3-methyl-2-oxobutanoate hydroxymethyltransferase